MVKIKKVNTLALLVGITLILTIVNVYVSLGLYAKLGAGQPFGNLTTTTINTAGQPRKVQVSLDNAPTKGSDNAPVTMLEFSDFQCPYCGSFVTGTLPQIEEKYINTGKVKLAFRNFPLSFHKYAEKAAEAASCANSQGKFWEYHDKLYANQNALDIASLKQYAIDLGLDVKKFNDCLDFNQTASIIQKDVSDGQAYGVGGTPDFFINGYELSGALPFSSFEQIIEQELSK